MPDHPFTPEQIAGMHEVKKILDADPIPLGHKSPENIQLPEAATGALVNLKVVYEINENTHETFDSILDRLKNEIPGCEDLEDYKKLRAEYRRIQQERNAFATEMQSMQRHIHAAPHEESCARRNAFFPKDAGPDGLHIAPPC